MYRYFNKKLVSKVVVGGMSSLMIAGAIPYTVLAAHEPANKPMKSYYTANLTQLNDSNVTGFAELDMKAKSNQANPNIKIKLRATGTTPGQTHPVHIHGKNNPEVALCPTTDADTNKDGFISVIEGAPSYGPIKVNLTSPQTPFGPSPSPLLFTPFAGTADNNNFPKADGAGNIALNQNYVFDTSEAAQAALASITPLEDQHIVVHGGMAPASVDADAFAALGTPITGSPEAIVYDVLLPVACGEINKVSADEVITPAPVVSAPVTPAPQPGAPVSPVDTTAVTDFKTKINLLTTNFQTAVQAAQVTFDASSVANKGSARDQYIAELQRARDHYVNQFYEARNQFVDIMNRAGNVEMRNNVSAQAEQGLANFTSTFEISKRDL